MNLLRLDFPKDRSWISWINSVPNVMGEQYHILCRGVVADCRFEPIPRGDIWCSFNGQTIKMTCSDSLIDTSVQSCPAIGRIRLGGEINFSLSFHEP